MSICNCFNCTDVPVPYQFIRRNLSIVLTDPGEYDLFYSEFVTFFLSKRLTPMAYEFMQEFLSGRVLDDKRRGYLKNTLRRVFSDDNHLKGLIGEHLLAFFYNKAASEFLLGYGPKGRSSAEPGIDYICFVGDSANIDNIRFIVWETKATENKASTRASEIYDFFSKNGSFDENIDAEMRAIQEEFKTEQNPNLRKVIIDMPQHVFERNKHMMIGACAIIPEDSTTQVTFKTFQTCLPELNKEQRLVKFIIVEAIERITSDLRSLIWNRL